MEGTHPLKSWRKSHNPPLSQKRAAEIVGSTKPTISRIETGDRTPSLALAAKLSEKTGIPINRFVKQDEAAQ